MMNQGVIKMNEITDLKVDNFLKENGFDSENLTLKQKKRILKNILFINDVDRDYLDLKHEHNPNSESRDEYVTKVQNLDIKKIEIIGNMLIVTKLQKENRKLKRKETFQKVMTIFKKQDQ